LPKPVPTAALTVIVYGEPATVAVAAAPLLASVTLVSESPLSSPAALKSVDGVVVSNVTACPYVLVLSAESHH